MKVKLANGVVIRCTAPTEQKVFKQTGENGWVLSLRLVGDITSAILDELLTIENFETLDFLSETEDGGEKNIFSLCGYDKITSSVIRYSEDITATSADIQLSKGI